MGKEKKEIKLGFDKDSLASFFDQIARDIKAGYMSFGEEKIEIPGNVDVEIEYKEKEKDDKVECKLEWELKWYK